MYCLIERYLCVLPITKDKEKQNVLCCCFFFLTEAEWDKRSVVRHTKREKEKDPK